MFCSNCGHEMPQSRRFCSECGTEQSPNASMTTEVPSYAGFWIRVAASVVDSLLSMALSVLIVLPLSFALGISMASSGYGDSAHGAGSVLGWIIGMIVGWLYYTVGESSTWQASVGKKLLGLKVTDLDGQQISFGKANARYWSKILSSLLLAIGYLMVAFSEKKQGLHDRIADTLVVHR